MLKHFIKYKKSKSRECAKEVGYKKESLPNNREAFFDDEACQVGSGFTLNSIYSFLHNDNDFAKRLISALNRYQATSIRDIRYINPIQIKSFSCIDVIFPD